MVGSGRLGRVGGRLGHTDDGSLDRAGHRAPGRDGRHPQQRGQLDAPAGTAPAWSGNRRATLVSISATMAPELPCADRIAACTMVSRSSGVIPGTAEAMPSRVSRRLVPVSESGTG